MCVLGGCLFLAVCLGLSLCRYACTAQSAFGLLIFSTNIGQAIFNGFGSLGFNVMSSDNVWCFIEKPKCLV